MMQEECGSIGVGYKSTSDLCNDFSGKTGEVMDGGDGGTPGPKDGMVVGMLLVLGFGWVDGSEEGAGSDVAMRLNNRTHFVVERSADRILPRLFYL